MKDQTNKNTDMYYSFIFVFFSAETPRDLLSKELWFVDSSHVGNLFRDHE